MLPILLYYIKTILFLIDLFIYIANNLKIDKTIFNRLYNLNIDYI